MQINTLQFGGLEIEEKELLRFEQGLPGFEHLRQFVIIKPEEELPVSFLQSVEDNDLSFIIADPFLYFPHYEFVLPESVQEELRVEQEQELAIWVILSIRDNLQEATANLLAPLVINVKAGLGKQVILHNTIYKTKHLLFPTSKEAVKGETHAST